MPSQLALWTTMGIYPSTSTQRELDVHQERIRSERKQKASAEPLGCIFFPPDFFPLGTKHIPWNRGPLLYKDHPGRVGEECTASPPQPDYQTSPCITLRGGCCQSASGVGLEENQGGGRQKLITEAWNIIWFRGFIMCRNKKVLRVGPQSPEPS